MKKHWILVCGSALVFAVACADTGGTGAGTEDAGTTADPVASPAAETAPASVAPETTVADDTTAVTRKLVSPVRGDATIEYTQPQSKRDGNFVVTTFRVKNVNSAPIAGFMVDEYWYDSAGNTVGGSPTFRQRSPLQPDEVITVELRTPVNPAMDRPQWKFGHANGEIKPTLVPKL